VGIKTIWLNLTFSQDLGHTYYVVTIDINKRR